MTATFADTNVLVYAATPLTLSVVEDALFLCASYQLSYWDAAIIAAARHLDCRTLLSEDLNHGQSYGGVLVQKPFAKLEHKE